MWQQLHSRPSQCLKMPMHNSWQPSSAPPMTNSYSVRRLYSPPKLRTLAETFEKVDEQSGRLTKDSEEMENLNRTLTGINKVYELHLKSISLQVGTIDEINNQTHKLSEQIQHLNQVYGRMIDALTVNMNMPRPAAPADNH